MQVGKTFKVRSTRGKTREAEVTKRTPQGVIVEIKGEGSMFWPNNKSLVQGWYKL